MYDNNTIDWGTAETLAYGTLLTEGYDVRISGQDVERGTFSHRHAVVKVEDSEEEVILLNQVKNKKGSFNIFNSLLSEYGVLGFRLWLCFSKSECFDDLGSTIWGFFKRSANHDRPIHFVWRRQMEQPKRNRVIVASRL